MNRPSFRTVAVILAFWAATALAAEPAGNPAAPAAATLDLLTKALTTPHKLLRGDLAQFTVTVQGAIQGGGQEMAGQLTFVRADAGRFGLAIRVGPLAAELVRDAAETRLVVPSKGVALVGKGEAAADSPLTPEGFVAGVLDLEPQIGTVLGLLQVADTPALALVLQQLGRIQHVPPPPGETAPATFVIGKLKEDKLTIQATPDGLSIGRIAWTGPQRNATFTLQITDAATLPAAATDGLTVVSVDRAELERTLGTALVRAADILRYNSEGPRLASEARSEGPARLTVAQGQRVAVLEGTPYAIGFQHGKLLAREARRLADAVLCVVGTAYSVEKKKWFLDEIRRVWKRSSPHIPAEYLEELRGLADGAGLPLETVQLANVFPEMFHCSGFVLLPQATASGELLHGRVLDYMTEVGLQRDAVIFVVKKQGCIPFVNVGYAGFIGSVTGMNLSQVCFGEMGGRGEGLWDGTPMALLLRMGLERAKTLPDAVRIFTEAKRTCEYYYALSDAKIPDAVGLYATPDRLDLIRPGQPYPPLLPTPVPHCLLMSGGDRFKALVEKARAKAGRFDVPSALALMDRPVAMRSNLHNVLFVPGQFALYVAHARGSVPACKEPYVRYDMRELLAPR